MNGANGAFLYCLHYIIHTFSPTTKCDFNADSFTRAHTWTYLYAHTCRCAHTSMHTHTNTHTHAGTETSAQPLIKKPRTLAQKKGQNRRQDTGGHTHPLMHTHKHNAHRDTHPHAGIRAVLSYNAIPFNVTFPLHCGALNGPVNNQEHNAATAGRQRQDT